MNKVELRSLLVDGQAGTPAARIVRLSSARGGLSAIRSARLTGLAKSTVPQPWANCAARGSC